MSDHEPPGGNCPRFAAQKCPSAICQGRANPGFCAHVARLTEWRQLKADEQVDRLGVPRPAIDPVVRDAVNSCPARGPVLPLSLQDDCGCRGQELSECRVGRGAIAGRVTLRDCLACKATAD